MYRICTVPTANSGNKAKPILCHNQIVEDYSDVHVNTLHKKNLLSLGEDRYLTTLILKTFPKMRTKFTPAAMAFTFAPETYSVLLSQRRRWINSTFHNLVELVWLKELCGFCCFSMRFVVFIDLLSTIIQPATVLYLGYLIYRTIQVFVEDLNINVVQVSLILLAAVYGLQAIVFILKKEFSHVVWSMC
jgi:chitin synthase